MVCYGGLCNTCLGAKHIVLGLIVLANWYWQFADWWLLIGLALVLMGLIKMVKPSCPHCVEPAKATVASKPAKKGK